MIRAPTETSRQISARATAACVTLILGLSSYPFHGWRWPGSDVWFFAWWFQVSRWDLILNLLLYVPLGFFATRWLGSRWRPAWAVVLATVLGAGLSLFAELLQIFLPQRFPSLLDLLANGAGTLAGALAVRSSTAEGPP